METREQPINPLPEAELDCDSEPSLPELDSPSSIELRSPKSSEFEVISLRLDYQIDQGIYFRDEG